MIKTPLARTGRRSVFAQHVYQRDCVCRYTSQDNGANGQVEMTCTARDPKSRWKMPCTWRSVSDFRRCGLSLSLPSVSGLPGQQQHIHGSSIQQEKHGGGRGRECGAKEGEQGQCSRCCSVIWEPVYFRSAKSGHEATAAQPQRPPYSFPSQPLICRGESLAWGNLLPQLVPFHSGRMGKGFTRQHYGGSALCKRSVKSIPIISKDAA